MPFHRLRTTSTPLWVGAAVVVADTATKALARRWLAGDPRHLVGGAWLRLSYNTGASFSVGHDWPAVVQVVELVALALVTGLALVSNPGGSRVGFGLILGGGFGNLIDRLASPQHAVTDFVALGSFPSFNLADACITVGVVVLLVVVARGRPLLDHR